MKSQNIPDKTPLQSKTTTNSTFFLVKLKRGISWSNRKIEISRERFKYSNPSTNEIRFNENIDDCILIEKHADDQKKYSLKLSSKTKKFDDVKINSDDKSVLKSLKKEFDSIINYKNTMSNIQNKTFIVETEKGKLTRSNTIKTLQDENQTVNKSIFEENKTDLRKSVYNNETNTELESNLLRESMINQIPQDTISNFPPLQQTNESQEVQENKENIQIEYPNILSSQPLTQSVDLINLENKNNNLEAEKQNEKIEVIQDQETKK